RGAIEMVATDDDRRGELAARHHVVEPDTEPVSLAEAQPADPRGEPLVGDPLAGEPDPPRERLVLGELVEHGTVGRGDVGGIARQRRPPERPLPLAEERPDVRGDETRVVEGTPEPAELRFRAEAVAVIEDLRATIQERD